MNRNKFEKICLSFFGERLRAFGFSFENSWSRPRGVAVKFCRDNDMILFAWEGGELVSDLVLFKNNTWMRISLNQLLWYCGAKDLPRKKSLEAKLAIFVKEFNDIWSVYLDDGAHKFPERCTYEMDQEEYQIYMETQDAC